MTPRGNSRISGSVSRRRLLATVCGGGIAALSGCSDPRNRTLHPETVEEDGETHLLYHADGDRVAEVSVIERWSREYHRWAFPIRTHVWHADGTHLESLEYTFRTRNADRPLRLYLERPGGYPWEPIRFSRGEDGDSTVLEVPDVGFQGRGSVGLDLLVEADDREFDLRIDVDATLTVGGLLGRESQLEGTIVRTIPPRLEETE